MTMVDNESLRPRIYTAYGQTDTSAVQSHAAYAGEIVESGADGYLLGQRPYAPALRRFLSPDTESPFGAGGWNRYAYCAGDPVGRVDPEGTFWHAFISLFTSFSSSARSAKNAYKTIRRHFEARSYTSADRRTSMGQQTSATLLTPTGLTLTTVAMLTAASAGSTLVSAWHLLWSNTDLATNWATAGAALGFVADPPVPKPFRRWLAKKLRIEVESPPDAVPKLERYSVYPRKDSGVDPSHALEHIAINVETPRFRGRSVDTDVEGDVSHSPTPSRSPSPSSPRSTSIDRSHETPWYQSYFNAMSSAVMDAFGLNRRQLEDIV